MLKNLIGRQFHVQIEKRTDERMREMNPRITAMKLIPEKRRPRKPRPRTYDARERFIDEVREAILTSKQTYAALAEIGGVSKTTVTRLAQGYTKWPRDTTLFPLLASVGLEITTRRKRKESIWPTNRK